MSEMALTAEHVIVVGRGRLMADMPMADLIAQASANVVSVRSPRAGDLAAALAAPAVSVVGIDGGLEVTGLTAAQIGDRARDLGIALHELTPKQASLEEAFMDMTHDEIEFHTRVAAHHVESSGERA
jgi:ABC-2 type transport system ATP-binding protein